MDEITCTAGKHQKMRKLAGETAAVKSEIESLERKILRYRQDGVDNVKMSIRLADAQGFLCHLDYLYIIEMVCCGNSNYVIEGTFRELQIGAIHALETAGTCEPGTFEVCRINVDPGIVL